MVRPDNFMGIVIFISIILMIMTIKYKNWKVFFYLLLMLGVYWGVGSKLNNEVFLSSIHGNTSHGWYSNNNEFEKALASLWIYGFPFLSIFVPIWIIIKLGRDNTDK